MPSDVTPISNNILYVVAVFLPPLAVFLKTGCSGDLLINCLLWILGWIPGIIHACWVVARRPGPPKYVY